MKKISRAFSIFMLFQLLALCIGICCIVLTQSGAYVFVLFGQTVATILFGIIISNKMNACLKSEYPYVSPDISFRIGSGFRFRYDYSGPMMTEAKRKGDDMTCAAIKKQRGMIILCGMADLSLGILALIRYSA